MANIYLAVTEVRINIAPRIEGNKITFEDGFLRFTLNKASTLKYEIFDAKGNLIKKEINKDAQKGIYCFNIGKHVSLTQLLIVKAVIDREERVFYYLPLSNNKGLYSPTPLPILENSSVAKIAAVVDTVKVTAEGYKSEVIPVSSYEMELNITLEATENTGNCGEIKFISCKLSSAIPTVGIVEWSYSKSVSSAYIEFGLEGSNTVMKAPVDLKEQNYRTLLLGMKQQKKYKVRIVVESGSGTCVSKDTTLTTGTLSNAPKITKSGSGSSSITSGFFVTSTGLGLSGGGGFGGGGVGTPMAIIFDFDGDVVWAASAPQMPSRVRMSWDGKYMWMINANVMGGTSGGETRRISMDGLKVDSKIQGLSGAHHDFTVTPNNEVIFIAHTNNRSSQILSYKDGTINTIVADVTTLYQPVGDVHPNYIQYDPSDDSFIISDRNPNLFVKFLRNGTLVWQFGGNNPKGKSFSVSESWQVNHGFEYESDGRFVFFNNGGGMGGSGSSKVMEFQLNESSMSSKKLWEKSTSSSSTLGNIQRLPDGHYLIVSSNSGKMEIINSAHNVVLTFSTTEFGYAQYLESLYSPPKDY